MTVKLYENNQYISKFDATVVDCIKCDDCFKIVLNQSAFFPEGGGQQSDLGTINGIQVSDVQICDGVIYHTVNESIAVDTVANCQIDWQTRFSRMQNHSGEHIVSGLIHSLFGYNNVGFHMHQSTMTVDVDGSLNSADISLIEKEANKIVYNNKKIYATYPSANQLDSIKYRSKLELTHGVRLINIEDCDCCACCAPHVAMTGEIGIIKILDFSPHRSGTRIEMVCGYNAFCDYQFLHNSNRSVMALLSASRDKVFESVLKQNNSLSALKQEVNLLSQQLTMAQLDINNINSLICAFADNATFDSLRYCSNQLVEKCDYCCAFAKEQDNCHIYIVSSNTNDVSHIVKALNTAFDGKGGGKNNYAQGKLNATQQDILNLLTTLL